MTVSVIKKLLFMLEGKGNSAGRNRNLLRIPYDFILFPDFLKLI
jgi:hypothetical protein